MRKTRRLFFGDNLEILREHIPDESIDLVYLDPPFNSNQSYNVLFKERDARPSTAQIEAFGDTWHWTPETQVQYEELVTSATVPGGVAKAVDAFSLMLGQNDVMAYLVMMTPRLLELHRVLKPTGSLYLHCDPTASHYLKIICDQIFDPRNFRNEIIWRRTGAHAPRKSYGPIHDTILFYTKSNKCFFNVLRMPYMNGHVDSRYKLDATGGLKFVSGGNVLTGAGKTQGESGMPWRGFNPSSKNRHWAIPGFLSEQMPAEFMDLSVLQKLEKLYEAGLIDISEGAEWPTPVRYLRSGDGSPIGDIWAYQPYTEGTMYGTGKGIDADVQWLGPTAPERLGYPTQKPLGVLQRVIRSSCPDNGVVLDPFCGCGTTIAAAESLGRSWIGIDITYLAIALIEQRLQDAYPGIEYRSHGAPKDMAGAEKLFLISHKNFETWVVRQIGGRPNPKQGGDEGADGIIRFFIDGKTWGTVVISVKGGDKLNPSMVRDLIGTVSKEKAEMGLLITRAAPTDGMLKTASKEGFYEWSFKSRPRPGYTEMEIPKEKFPKIQIITVQEILKGVRPHLPPIHGTYAEAPRGNRYEQLGLP